MKAKRTVYVNEFTDGILDPIKEMEYIVKVWRFTLLRIQLRDAGGQ